MGDATTCFLVVGGKTTKRAMRNLFKQIDEHLGNPGDELPDEGGICDFGEFEEVNYGTLPAEVWRALRDARLTFRWSWYEGWDYGRGYIFWKPGMEEPDDPHELRHYWQTHDGKDMADVSEMTQALEIKPDISLKEFLASLEIPGDPPPIEWGVPEEADPGPHKERPTLTFTVVGYWPETGERFCDHYEAVDAAGAEAAALAQHQEAGLAVAGVFAGKHMALDEAATG